MATVEPSSKTSDPCQLTSTTYTWRIEAFSSLKDPIRLPESGAAAAAATDSKIHPKNRFSMFLFPRIPRDDNVTFVFVYSALRYGRFRLKIGGTKGDDTWLHGKWELVGYQFRFLICGFFWGSRKDWP